MDYSGGFESPAVFVGIILVLIGMSVMGTSIFVLIPLVYVEVLGAEHLTTAMGAQFVCQAVGFFLISVMTGIC